MNTPEYTYEVDDPVIGFVNCSSLDEAKLYASQINGEVYRQLWVEGEVHKLERLNSLTNEWEWMV